MGEASCEGAEPSDFTPTEVSILRTTFDQIKGNRDQFALHLLERVSTVDRAVECYEKAMHDVKNNWCAVSLGIMYMSGIERCLLRADSPKNLRALIKRLKTTHREKIDVPPQMLTEALRVSESTILEELGHYHEHNDAIVADDGTRHCQICQTWEKFLSTISNLVMSPDTD